RPMPMRTVEAADIAGPMLRRDGHEMVYARALRRIGSAGIAAASEEPDVHARRRRRPGRRLAVERHQRGTLPPLHRPRAIPARTGAHLQGAELVLSLPCRRDRRAGRLGGDDGRRGRGGRRPRPGRRDQRLCQPLRPSRQPAVFRGPGPRARDHLHLSRLELRPGRPADRRRLREGGQAPGLRAAELCGLVFGSLDPNVPDLETYLGPLVVGGVRRVLAGRTPVVIGRSTQVLPNNWKLYFENVKDTYHASILHTFLNIFRINRLSQPGAVNICDTGGNHFSVAKLDYAAEDEDYRRERLRASTELQLEDRSIVDSIDEYGDQISVQILTIFPGMVLQQIRNTLAIRVLRPRGVDRSELDWIHLGFAEDDAAIQERRLRQGNLIGAA